MAWLEWEKKRNLGLATIALAGLANIRLFGISTILSKLMDYQIVGEINIGTIIGIITVILVYMIWQRKGFG